MGEMASPPGRVAALIGAYTALGAITAAAARTPNVHFTPLAVIPLLYIAYYARVHISLLVACACAAAMAMYDQAPVVTGGQVHVPALFDAAIRWLSFCAVVIISRRLREASNVNAALNVHLLRARRIAANDPLTGIANRSTFMQALADAAKSASAQRPAGVFFCDLDGFKQVNDTHGHTAGDAVLQMASARIANAVRTDDVVGRLGGDEFGVLAQQVHGASEAARMAAQIERAFHHPFQSGETTYNVGITIGVSICPDDGTSPETLLRCADERMYGAKQAKRIGR